MRDTDYVLHHCCESPLPQQPLLNRSFTHRTQSNPVENEVKNGLIDHGFVISAGVGNAKRMTLELHKLRGYKRSQECFGYGQASTTDK